MQSDGTPRTHFRIEFSVTLRTKIFHESGWLYTVVAFINNICKEKLDKMCVL